MSCHILFRQIYRFYWSPICTDKNTVYIRIEVLSNYMCNVPIQEFSCLLVIPDEADHLLILLVLSENSQ